MEINDAAEFFISNIQDGIELFTPNTTKYRSEGNKNHIPKSLLKLIKQRDTKKGKLGKLSEKEKNASKQEIRQFERNIKKQIRQFNFDQVQHRISKAGKPHEIWNIIKNIVKPKREGRIELKEGDHKVSNNRDVAEVFNNFFISKIENLKNGINPSWCKDPMSKLRGSELEKPLENMNISPVSEHSVALLLNKLESKTSCGPDRIPPIILKQCSSVLTIPLTWLINMSITTSIYPDCFKEAKVIPIYKKGDKGSKNNYRPVSNLSEIGKILEAAVESQIRKYFEDEKLLPDNQHGFREKRSTTTALIAATEQWLKGKGRKKHQGCLLYDLSAAFDLVDSQILADKMKMMGVGNQTINWIKSYLSDRYQRVNIGNEYSSRIGLKRGSPQGSRISPLLYLILVADLNQWLEKDGVNIYTFADDTTVSCEGDNAKEVIDKIERCAKQMIEYISSNSLVVNPSKTVFIMFRPKRSASNSDKYTITVGTDKIEESEEGTLLGITINNKLNWDSHYAGKGKLMSQLRQRMFILKRIKGRVPKHQLLQLARAIFITKLTYGSAVFSHIRINTEKKEKHIGKLQVLQNKMLRMLSINHMPRMEWGTQRLCEKYNQLSINQLYAKIKVLEFWKIMKQTKNPLKSLIPQENQSRDTRTRFQEDLKLQPVRKAGIKSDTFVQQAISLWNMAPKQLRETNKYTTAKKIADEFVKSIPY